MHACVHAWYRLKYQVNSEAQCFITNKTYRWHTPTDSTSWSLSLSSAFLLRSHKLNKKCSPVKEQRGGKISTIRRQGEASGCHDLSVWRSLVGKCDSAASTPLLSGELVNVSPARGDVTAPSGKSNGGIHGHLRLLNVCSLSEMKRDSSQWGLELDFKPCALL